MDCEERVGEELGERENGQKSNGAEEGGERQVVAGERREWRGNEDRAERWKKGREMKKGRSRKVLGVEGEAERVDTVM